MLKKAIETDDKELLALLEAIGDLALCVHWMRGTFRWMANQGLITFAAKQDEQNYWRLFSLVEEYERYAWEIAPSRSILPALRHYRIKGELVDGWEELLIKDLHGRVPYGTNLEQLEDIQDALRRLGEARQAGGNLRERNLEMTEQQIRRKVEELGPWHYCHLLPHGVLTGDSPPNHLPDKMERLAPHLDRTVYPRVLDLGANSGIISMWFCDNKRSVVDAVEGSSTFYPQLEFVTKLKGYTSRINPIKADICSYKPREDFYDLVIFLGTMHHLPCKQESLEMIKKALKPGGQVIVQTKTKLPVGDMLNTVGFDRISHLYDHKGYERSAWKAYKDPMKVGNPSLK